MHARPRGRAFVEGSGTTDRRTAGGGAGRGIRHESGQLAGLSAVLSRAQTNALLCMDPEELVERSDFA